MDADITYHRLKFGWLIGVALAFGIFVLVALYAARMTDTYPDYDQQRADQRKATLTKVQHEENMLLYPTDKGGNPSATWVDQDKGFIQISIDEAMTHQLVDLKNEPLAIGAAIPGSTPAPAPAPAATNAAPAPPAAKNAAPAKPKAPSTAPAKPKKKKTYLPNNT